MEGSLQTLRVQEYVLIRCVSSLNVRLDPGPNIVYQNASQPLTTKFKMPPTVQTFSLNGITTATNKSLFFRLRLIVPWLLHDARQTPMEVYSRGEASTKICSKTHMIQVYCGATKRVLAWYRNGHENLDISIRANILLSYNVQRRREGISRFARSPMSRSLYGCIQHMKADAKQMSSNVPKQGLPLALRSPGIDTTIRWTITFSK